VSEAKVPKTSVIFALQREELVEERPFRAAKDVF